MLKTALVTGGTKGIGAAVARAFMNEGYAVTIAARSERDLARMATAGFRTIAADLATEGGVEAIPRAYFDVVILNAASYRPGGLLAENNVYERLYPLNVIANYRLIRRLVPQMIARGDGHVIIIGSTGTDHWKERMTAYVATKFALRGLFLAIATELAPTPVQATLVAPGATLTHSWAGETPPPDIMLPDEVARVVLDAARLRKGGRIVVGA